MTHEPTCIVSVCFIPHSSDVAIKQYLVYLDQKEALGRRCVCACVHACVRACVRVCVCVCVCLAKCGIGMVTISTTCTTSFIHNRFILQDLDELHIFVSSDVAKLLQQKIDELMEKNSYSEFDQQAKAK